MSLLFHYFAVQVRAIEAMGDKIESKQIAIDAGINTIPGFQGVIKDEVSYMCYFD
jgi:propionyl-CoA carboxylase alpha chain